ncbi:MAG: P1 family peptidase, partial [Acidimicrobiales bacterium]
MRLDVDGVEVGHWSDPVARTGCTVIVLPEATVASGEVRGGAPATREFALLDPQRLVDRVDAVVLTGGSAFGLASADGVAAELERMDRGFPTPAGPVPIVVAMALFDLAVGDATVRPGPAAGRRAFAARSHDPAVGTVGAGTGATIAKWRGPDRSRPGGLGVGTVARGDLVVTAVVAVNAAGEPDGGILEEVTEGSLDGWAGRSQPFTNTTIGCVVTN